MMSPPASLGGPRRWGSLKPSRGEGVADTAAHRCLQKARWGWADAFREALENTTSTKG